jgi:gas vesicle protein
VAERGGPGFLAGFAIGTLAGATLAMVLAPQSGEDTRDMLYAKAREAGERARDSAGDASDLLARGRRIVAEARARLDEALSEGKDAAERQRSTLEKES